MADRAEPPCLAGHFVADDGLSQTSLLYKRCGRRGKGARRRVKAMAGLWRVLEGQEGSFEVAACCSESADIAAARLPGQQL